jgi:hypothetical protein
MIGCDECEDIRVRDVLEGPGAPCGEQSLKGVGRDGRDLRRRATLVAPCQPGDTTFEKVGRCSTVASQVAGLARLSLTRSLTNRALTSSQKWPSMAIFGWLARASSLARIGRVGDPVARAGEGLPRPSGGVIGQAGPEAGRCAGRRMLKLMPMSMILSDPLNDPSDRGGRLRRRPPLSTY